MRSIVGRHEGTSKKKCSGTNRKKHPHVEFPGREIKLVFDLECVCRVRARRVHKVFLRQLSAPRGYQTMPNYDERKDVITYSSKI